MNNTIRKIQAAIVAAVGLFFYFYQPWSRSPDCQHVPERDDPECDCSDEPLASLCSTVSFGWLAITVFAGIILLIAVAYAFF